jgi:uncharacterized LabA/DUF88 family protein
MKISIAFLIDGFNFYYSIKNLSPKYRWFDYSKFCRYFAIPNGQIHSIHYFSAIATWLPSVAQRHQAFITAQEHNGVEVILGEFKDKHRCCHQCRYCYIDHEEKRTDVNIALHAYRIAAKPEVDKIILVSNDSDFVPIIETIRMDFPQKQFGVIFPYQRFSAQINNIALLRIKQV